MFSPRFSYCGYTYFEERECEKCKKKTRHGFRKTNPPDEAPATGEFDCLVCQQKQIEIDEISDALKQSVARGQQHIARGCRDGQFNG